jgi:hypothetical protein
MGLESLNSPLIAASIQFLQNYFSDGVANNPANLINGIKDYLSRVARQSCGPKGGMELLFDYEEKLNYFIKAHNQTKFSRHLDTKNELTVIETFHSLIANEVIRKLSDNKRLYKNIQKRIFKHKNKSGNNVLPWRTVKEIHEYEKYAIPIISIYIAKLATSFGLFGDDTMASFRAVGDEKY